jgi:hypothetical protein
MAQGITYSSIDQSTYNSLVLVSVLQATAVTDGDLDLATATQSGGVGTANYAPNVPIPMSLAQANGILTFEDNGPTLRPFIPPASTSISSTESILEFVIALSSPQYPTYSATIDTISVSLNGGTPVDIPFTLDTSSTQFEGVEINLGQSVSDFSLGFNLNLPTTESSSYEASDFWVLGIGQVPEPSTVALAVMGTGLFGLGIYSRARKRRVGN